MRVPPGRLLAVVTAAVLGAGCGGSSTLASSPSSFEGQVTVPVPIGAGDVVGSQVLAVAMNPIASYRAFLDSAMARLGKNPSRVEVRAAALRLLPTSTGATKLEDVLTGDVLVSFAMAAPALYDVASVRSPVGAGPVPLQVRFDPASVASMDMTHLCSGSLDVYLGGTPAPGFAPARSSVELEVALDLVAVE